MAKVAIYVRTSTNLQSSGLESQLHALKSYCESKGLTNYSVYSDAGISGAKCSRPALDQLTADVEEKKIDLVITYSLSRLSRSTAHLLQVVELFQKHGVGFISLSESIDINSAMGKMILTVLGAVSTLEREIIVERVKTGLINAKAKGKKLGAIKKYTNPQPFIELRKNGLTVRQIAKVLKCSTSTVMRQLQTYVPETPVNDTNTTVR